MTGARVDVALFYFVYPLVEAGGSGLGSGYCWSRGWLYPAGVGLLAHHRVVLGTRPPFATNVVNNTRNFQAEKSAFSITQ